MNKRVWTSEEDEYIRIHFKKKSFSEMAKYLNCTITTVQNRAKVLGFQIENKKVKRWTDEEINLLKIMAPKYLNKTIARKLNRSVSEVNKKARELEIELIFKRPVWQKWKVKFLKENINTMSLSQIGKELDVNYYQIIDKLDEIGIEYNNSFWSEEEINILTELASQVYIRELAKILNRTEGAIISKANRLGLSYITIKKVYSNDELEYIKNNWGIIPVTDIARNLGVSRMMIQLQADKMNLPKLGNNPYKKWTPEEIEKLNDLASKKSITELAKYFNTTNSAITTVAYKNRIYLKDDKIHWTDEDNETLKKLAKSLDLSELAIKMNKSTSAIRLQATRQNIRLIPDKKFIESVWTEENNKELKKLVDEGKLLLEISNLMNKKAETVLKKARKLNLNIKIESRKEWSENEVIRLRELAKTKRLSELVKELNRTSSSIRAMAKKLEINIISDRKNWTKEEYQLLEKMTIIDRKTPKEIADILGRSEDAVIIKINRRGLKIQTNDKRFWTEEEETMLSDLWGTESFETIAKKLNRTVSSIKNKAFLLGLGAAMENNYNGLTIKEISDLFSININTISVGWISLGLKYKIQKISKSRSYRYVEIKDLYDFLEANQNIWDSRNLEKNILGVEPEWLKEKRKLDSEQNFEIGQFDLTKQQLILARKFFLELQETKGEQERLILEESNPQLSLNLNKKKR